MSVQVDYQGRFGNNVFQYLCARLFAEENGLELRTSFSHEAFRVEDHRLGLSAPDDHGPEIGLTDGQPILDQGYPPGRYRLRGFFQKASWYWSRRARILEILTPKPVSERPSDHVLVTVRLGDYWSHRIVIHPEWYERILGSLRFSRLVVVTDDAGDSYHKVFSRWHPEIISTSVASDFNTIRSFNTVVLGNSTLAWWAAFFGVASKIYTFKPWIRNKHVDLASFPGSEPVDGRFFQEPHA